MFFNIKQVVKMVLLINRPHAFLASLFIQYVLHQKQMDALHSAYSRQQHTNGVKVVSQ
jgi:hypothetical protein